MATIFKKIIDREIPAKILYEDDLCLAFADINPQAPSHVLLIPRKEIPTLADVAEGDRELMGHLMLKAAEIASRMGLAEEGYRVVVNCGRNAGQEVFHLHLHILGGRRLSWPPG